jgi:hypothetical protein
MALVFTSTDIVVVMTGGEWRATPRPNTYRNRTFYFVTRTSTRRFLARPASVVFGATGLVSA